MTQINTASPRTKQTNSNLSSEKDVHLVTLKVNRIYKPSFELENVISHEKSDLTSAALLYHSSSRFADSQIQLSGVNNLCLSPMFIIPLYNGVISLGEVFGCYVSIYNHSDQPVQNVSLKVELHIQSQSQSQSQTQVQTQKVTAFDSTRSENQTNTQILLPGHTVDFIIRQAVWESGTYLMACIVGYQKQTGEKKQFKKFFKFVVAPSLNFDHKISLVRGEFIVESTLTNVSQVPLYIENVEFLPEEHFHVLDLNPTQNTLNLPQNIANIVGSFIYIQSGDARKFVFKLIYRNPFDPDIINSNILGRLRVQWKSPFGDPASYTTEPIPISFTQDRSVGIVFTEIPSKVILEQPFCVTFTIINRSNKPIQPSISVLKHKLSGLVLIDNYEQVLDTIPPKNNLIVTISLLPLKTGIQRLPLLRIKDTLTEKVYDFINVLSVLVTTPENNTKDTDCHEETHNK